jgi:hypothetical protein
VTHAVSPEDQRFRAEFEAGRLRPEDFDQRAHVRLAYVYLVDNSTATALALLRQALQSYLNHNGLELSRHHEIMSRAWILAVREIMDGSPAAGSADEFMQRNPSVLDAQTMSSQYATASLLSPES